MPTELDRRSVLALGAALAAGSVLPARAQDAAAAAMHERMMTTVPEGAPTISMMVYPKMVAQDLIGPMTVFSIMRANIELVWKDAVPVSTDVGIPFAATHTFETAARTPDVLFVPGGLMGTIEAMNDPAVIDYLADRGSRAKWVTSVCTGSLVLGGAGLLEGYDATSHWGVADLLPMLGARHVDARVVRDRNRMTGGGVTAGIDFGLTLAAEMQGVETARRIQLIIEYAPEPPFRNGTPKNAGPERMSKMREGRRSMDDRAAAAATLAGRRLGTV